ncbi:hypothetical protein BH09VER1_BH09VER1_40730 [soil metagenome]
MITLWKKFGLCSAGRQSVLALAIIAAGALAAYWNSFSGPFVFDDKHAIVDNPTIRNLWPIWPVITPLSGGGTVCGRPILNLSFAINYALSGVSVWGYHAVNLLIHILAGWTLYGFIRRTLLQPSLCKRFGVDAGALAVAVAVLWVLHPLQTESVTYMVQRAESLAGLFYLLTLYCFVRGVKSERSKVWLWIAVLTCAIGMGAKETVASVPVIVLLYDRTFVAGSFWAAWRNRWAMYSTMAATWLLLLYFILATGDRGGTAGLAEGTTPVVYAQTQICAIVEYLRLVVWPHPLVFDYGTPTVTSPTEFVVPAILLLGIGGAAVVGVWRRSLFGFLGCWFFALLAPSSSVVAVVTQTVAEHRMYLASAAVIAVIVFGVYRWIGTKALTVYAGLAVVLGVLTMNRNKDYRSEFSIWNDTVTKCPGNARALANLGAVYLRAQQYGAAQILLEESIRVNPGQASAHSDLGIILCASEKMNEGVNHFRTAVQLNPQNVSGQINLGVALTHLGNWREARFHLEEALRLEPGNVLARKGLEDLQRAVEKSKNEGHGE